MEFFGVNPNDILVMRGAALAMGLDHNGDTYYVLILISGDADGEQVATSYAIPPTAHGQFMQVVKAMEPIREEPV